MPLAYISSALHKDGISQLVEFLLSSWSPKFRGGVTISECIAGGTAEYTITEVFAPLFRQVPGEACAAGDNMIEGHVEPVFICGRQIHAAVSAPSLSCQAHEHQSITVATIITSFASHQSPTLVGVDHKWQLFGVLAAHGYHLILACPLARNEDY
jgi:hypothetical protein